MSVKDLLNKERKPLCPCRWRDSSKGVCLMHSSKNQQLEWGLKSHLAAKQKERAAQDLSRSGVGDGELKARAVLEQPPKGNRPQSHPLLTQFFVVGRFAGSAAAMNGTGRTAKEGIDWPAYGIAYRPKNPLTQPNNAKRPSPEKDDL